MPYVRPTRRSPSRRRRFGAARRPTEWVRQLVVSGVNPPAPYSVDLLPGSIFDRGAIIGSTITRVRSDISLSHSGTGLSVNSGIFAGVVLVPAYDSAFFPNVGDPGGADYMWWRYIPWSSTVLGTASGATAAEWQVSFEIDVKAQRRLSGGKTTAILLVNTTGIPALTGFVAATSTLLKLA